MGSDLIVQNLFDLHRERLGLEWVAGKDGANREIKAERTLNFPTSVVGHLNLVRPNRVQVLGRSECEYVKTLKGESGEEVLGKLFEAEPACIIVADGFPPAESLLGQANRTGTPLLRSSLPSQRVVENLQHHLSHLLAKRITVHGVFMEVMGAGVLITGDAGVGKSELALELVTRGHRLVADDAADFALVAPETLEGTCPPALTDFMEVRGLGIVNVRALFGDSAVKPRKFLRLIVHLEPMEAEKVRNADRLRGTERPRSILGVEIPEVTLPVAPGRNMAVLVESTVRNHILRAKGYDSAIDFTQQHQRIIEQDS